MSESTLSFAGSDLFRKQLLVRNLQPYKVPGVFTPTEPAVNYETNLTVSNVIDSDNSLVSTNVFAENLYPLNEYGPEGGFGQPIGINSIASTNNPQGTNQGPYDPNDTVLDIINEFYIESAYVKNIWGPTGGYKDLVIITDIQTPFQYFSPYTDPNYFNFSTYSTYNIVFQPDPLGSNGLLSQDSKMMKIAATQLKGLFQERIDAEIAQNTIGLINLDTITDPFSASLIATGQQNLFEKNWKITVPENPLSAAVSLANRLTGTYFPVSFIPGDYFDEVNPYTNPGQTSNALNVANNLTGGLLSPILNKTKNPSEIFVANTGGGTRSILFATLDYNKYRPSYNIGLIQGISAFFNNLVDQDTPASGGYYVGSKDADPSLIDSPPNQVPVDEFGKQVATIVYGPQELGILYEGNIGQLQFGLAGKSYTDDGGLTGQLVWTSPKYNPNSGWKVGKGGDPKFVDEEFNTIQADYNKYRSTDIDFKPGSILDKTQRLVESADQVQGATRLKHVGNAINQISKVFNDGYKEITKGSKVMSYTDQTTGQEAGIEYCRIFQKDTPYFTFADLQKTDGIVNENRQFTYSVFDKTYNLNIAPLRNPGSTNIINGKVKKYMFSLENLAWRTSDRPGFTYNDLPDCEKGPNGGRIMWFPPYDLKFNDDSTANFNETSFLGRPEPIYTYKDTSRNGSLSWTIIVDHPSVLNTIIEKQLENASKERVEEIVNSFFAGCVKYDIYELAAKYNSIPPKDLFTYQQIINNPRLTTEEYETVLNNIGTNPEGSLVIENSFGGDGLVQGQSGSGKIKIENLDLDQSVFDKYVGFGFYFHNDLPDKKTELQVATAPFNVWYDEYISLKNTEYEDNAPEKVFVGTEEFLKSAIPQMFSTVVEGNFDNISKKLIPLLDRAIVEKKGTVSIKLVGSASAPNTPEYNINLSKRRISSVIQWFEKQPTSDGKTFKEYMQGGTPKLIFADPSAEGEGISIVKQATTEDDSNPYDAESTIAATVDCRVDIKQLDGSVKVTTINAQRYSVPAMACRRVVLKEIKVEIPVENDDEIPIIEQEDKEVPGGDKDVQTPTTGLTRNIKPQAEVAIEQSIKNGISKKILRNLFSECDYFEVIKETNPMIYDSIKEKIKYFSPAFHSMTPEGLNARLTFLNQCVRPGQTIPVIGPDGRPKYNDALNTAFGSPPILVLRIGDFYHTKIVPKQLSIQYEPLVYDMNPEGIGIQPMFAKITLGFSIIGGMGLKEPVQELQNALSFNFYANTEIYDERATATEDTSKLDKMVVDMIGAKPPTISSNIQNVTQPKKGQSAIGNLSGADLLDYTAFFEELQTNTTSYIEAYFNYAKQMHDQNNFGILQLANKEVNYNKGKLAEYTAPTEISLYGKPKNPQSLIDELISKTRQDVKKRKDPIMFNLEENSKKFKNKTLREIEEKLMKIVEDQNPEISNSVNSTINDFVKVQENLNFTFRKMDVVINNLDGLIIDTNNPLLYDLSGDTFFGDIDSDQSVNFLYLNDADPVAGVTSTFKRISLLNDFMNETLNVPKFYNTDQSTLNVDVTFGSVGGSKFLNEEDDRFYLVMAQIMVDSTKKQKLITDLTDGPEVKKEPEIIEALNEVVNSISIRYENNYNDESSLFNDLESDVAWTDIKNYKLPTIPSIVSYTTPPTQDLETKNKKIKDLYASSNLNEDESFNGKVTFN